MRRRKINTLSQVPLVPYAECPAKTFTDKYGQVCLGRSVFNHCQIVGHIARKLLSQLPVSLTNQLFPTGSELLAAAHDIGKVSPTFFLKLHRATHHSCDSKLSKFSLFFSLNETSWGGHAGVSALTLKQVGFDGQAQTVVGQHHGFNPEVNMRSASDECFGGEVWQKERKALLDALGDEFEVNIPENLTEAQVRAISGLTSVADWIGSGSWFDNPASPWQINIDKAITSAGYIPFKVRKGLTFSDTFGFSPREAQSKLLATCDQPGVYVLEAPMGLGKTEAALYCAYKMLATGIATGIYFALPTQLTSNKIYERFNQFLTTILDEDCPHRRALLLHGSAWLEETEMAEEGAPGSSWFNTSKRGLLAPFAVGTLDQALMATMNVRHGFVRAFGLAGKVVILDEIHSYDAYTSVILDELVALLVELKCTVIILSATLSQARRQSLLSIDVCSKHYPLITAVKKDVEEILVSPPPVQNVHIQFVSNESMAVEESLRRAELGQQVLWVENTVKEAQERYLDFAARCHELGISCGLLHSRFTPDDRASCEDKWVTALGKSGWHTRQQKGCVIVGTQVLEQSLDIDADFLITRFAPTDMMLQRLGRLWRHNDTPRPDSARCEAWLLAPSLNSAIHTPRTSFGASAAVYSEYVLCRSLEAWTKKLTKTSLICLPTDIRPLIDDTYHERKEEGPMAAMRYQLMEGSPHKKGLNALRQLARLTLSEAGKARSDTDAQTRYSEEDSAEILLLSSMLPDSENKQTKLTLLNGDQLILPWQKHRLNAHQWRSLSRKLMRQVVPCRRSQMPQTLPRERCRQLGFGHVFYLGHPEFAETVPFAIAIQSLDRELQGFEQRLSDRFTYQYRQDIGLQIFKNKE
ncbi:CRISPR-associated helicase Cas3' (plasmid) [Vibrio azureus]|uniref:CRISPR-associated helicase Cas3 n=1 Tax=Vibrio azureus NBRC 104587 TaxID=1219077 RepID=U3C8T0_9VIBR|nr:CRISPR-associated helicase Cas3' [Vibrio azureus]AUI89001.1 CRISPR-associated helicase Cas3' [Vibrio azureus]GAD77769.1 CRISPR-associated helicase Cas3 [Vibrio azureus NBRC 104587]